MTRHRKHDRAYDDVARALARRGGRRIDVIQWVQAQRHRSTLRRRAAWCLFAGWLLLCVTSIISSVVALRMSGSVRDIFDDEFRGDTLSMFSLVYVPWFLVAIAVGIVLAGVLGLTFGHVPGLKSTFSAIDWSTISDAVGRLLSAGFTFPEAFRTAAVVSRQRDSRRWLLGAAERVENGQPPVQASVFSTPSNDQPVPSIPPASRTRGDAAMLELMLEAAEKQAEHQWRLASEHFLEVAHRRLLLLTHGVPVAATILAGFLIWISIASTLGWMWKSVVIMVNSLGY